MATSVAYSIAGLWWAISMFKREDVLFREAERFDVRLWLRHLFRDKEATPNFSEAVLCFVLIMLLQFAVLPFLRGGLSRRGDRSTARSSCACFSRSSWSSHVPASSWASC